MRIILFLSMVGLAGLAGLMGCGEDGVRDACPAGGPRDGYPAGPYGTSVGAVLGNHEFVAGDGTPFLLESIHQDGANRLLLVSTAAGWCTACIEEQPTLQGFYDDHHGDGLAVLVALFEDDQFNPAEASLADAWATQHDLTFPVVADPDFLLDAYYDSTLTPMNMLVDVCSMKILKIGTGSDTSAIEAIIETRL